MHQEMIYSSFLPSYTSQPFCFTMFMRQERKHAVCNLCHVLGTNGRIPHLLHIKKSVSKWVTKHSLKTSTRQGKISPCATTQYHHLPVPSSSLIHLGSCWK